jgi:hypothetical protein
MEGIRKRERNKRRRHSIRKKRKEKIERVLSRSKDLEKQLVDTRSQLEKSKLKSIELGKKLYNTPKAPLRPMISSARYSIQSRPTPSSLLHPQSHRTLNLTGTLKCKVNQLDKCSLQRCSGSQSCELGSGTFGKCTKMLLCATEVAVKTITLDDYSYNNIMREAMIMADICHGHPNVPLFIGVYDQQGSLKPLIVMKYYSVAGKPYSFHQYLRNDSQQRNLPDLARILLGICNGLQAIHCKGYLHNDLKCDNIVLSDNIPYLEKPQSLWPIVIDFGKARPIKDPKTYKLNEKERDHYFKTYTHLAPELVMGACPQSVLTDVYSLCRIIGKAATVTHYKQLNLIANLCTRTSSIATRPSLLLVHESVADLAE